MVRNGEFEIPELAEVYDTEYGWGSDDDHMLEFVTRSPAAARPTWVAGPGGSPSCSQQPAKRWWEIDPAVASLDRARVRAGGEAVRWIHGTASSLPPSAFDCVGDDCPRRPVPVADDEWRETAAIQASLFPIGRLYFDSRDP